MTISNVQLSKQLTAKYDLPHRRFGLPESKYGTNAWIFRRMITNIIVGGSSEENTLEASEQIFRLYPTCNKLIDADKEILIGILNRNAIRRSKSKAEYVIGAAITIKTEFGGTVPDDRKSLESIRGVGRHTASIVLALGFNKPALGVDLHVRRIAKRLGIAGEKDSDLTIETNLMKTIEPEQYGAFSRAFVDFGKNVCAHTPDCARCFLKKKCSTGNGTIVPVKTPKKKVRTETASVTSVTNGTYNVIAGSSDREYTVVIAGDKVGCDCKGFRYRRTCSHVEYVRENHKN